MFPSLAIHPIVWIIIAVGFLALEGASVALVSIWFAVGGLAGLVLNLLGCPVWAQVTAFLLVSGLMLALLRPIMRKRIRGAKTNIDSIIGSRGLVTTAIDNVAYVGEVRLGAMTWTARSTDDSPIPVGTQVRVDRIEGVKVFVTPVKIESVQE